VFESRMLEELFGPKEQEAAAWPERYLMKSFEILTKYF
jgi:hypothetical protein